MSTPVGRPRIKNENLVWVVATLTWVAMVQPATSSGSGGGTGGTVDQGLAGASPWLVTGPLTDTQLRATAVPTSVASLPLPSGAATGVKQDTGNTSLASIDTKTPALGQALAAASVPVILPSATITTLTPPAAISGFALEAGHLATIDSVQGTQGDSAWVSGNGTVVALLKKIASAGGSAVSVADGSDVAQGTTSDAAWVSGSGTVISLLKKIASAGGSAVSIADGADTAQGTTTDLSSASTVIGLLKNLKAALAGTLAVSGPLTDTQIRATALPVSGTVAVTSAGLTNLDVALSTRTKPADQQHTIIDSGTTTVTQATGTNLHVVVDTAPTTAVTGPLTDTQLRATPVPISGTVTTTPPSNASTNIAQVAGTTADVNSGVKSAGTLRVVLATDQPSLTNKLLVTPDSVALPANQSVNTSQVNGVTVLTGTGATGTGAQRVTVAVDSATVAGSASLPAGTNVIGHVIHDTGSTTAVTGNVTVVQPTGTALHAVLDTTSTTAVTQATGTNLHTVIDSGTLTTVSTVTAVTAITNALPTGTNTLGSVKITDGTNVAKVTLANAQPASTDGAQLVNAIDTFAGTALASASRGVATVNTDIVNYSGKGIRVWQDLTVLGASSVCTFTIQEKDPVSGKFVTLLASAATGAGINSTGTAKLTIYPALTAAVNSIANDVVPMNIRIVSTVATAASTFSIGYSLIP